MTTSDATQVGFGKNAVGKNVNADEDRLKAGLRTTLHPIHGSALEKQTPLAVATQAARVVLIVN